MLANPNAISTEEGKAWLIAQQREILAKMHVMKGDGSRGGGV